MINKKDKQSIDEANDNFNTNNSHSNKNDNIKHDNSNINGDMENNHNESKDFISDLRTNMNNQDKLHSLNDVNTNINNENVHFDSNNDNQLANKPKPSRKLSLLVTNAISHSVSQIMNFSYQPLQNSAPFTGEYFCYIPNTKQSQQQCENCFSCKDRKSLSSTKNAKMLKQLQNGWHIIKKFEDDDRIKNVNKNKKRMVQYKIKIWTRDSHAGGQRRVIGDLFIICVVIFLYLCLIGCSMLHM
jgi:hypothetical protein